MNGIGSEADKTALTLRLRRIEGQLRGVQRMISEDADCERIAQQLAAARKSLDRTFYEMIACMLENELDAELGRKPQVRTRIAEMTKLLAKFA
ncbi:MAG TPA: metal-sensing transcriptional repressor [Burkholderiales bacterium]